MTVMDACGKAGALCAFAASNMSTLCLSIAPTTKSIRPHMC